MAIDAMVVELTSHLSAETAVTDELASGDPALVIAAALLGITEHI